MTSSIQQTRPPLLPRISDYAQHYAQRTPLSEAMVVDEHRISYRELSASVDALARALIAAGVRKGDRVATLATPHPDYFVAFLASASIGAIWVGLNPRYRLEELQYALHDSQPVVLLTRSRIGDRLYDTEIASLRGATSSLRHTVLLGEGQECAGCEGHDEFLRGGISIGEAELVARRAACGGRDPCLLVYTSGSTGRPKGAILHHQALVEVSRQQNAVWPLSSLRTLNYFPINHVGCVADLSCPTLVGGGCLVFLEQFEPARALELMQRERVTFWGSVPSTFQMQLALPDFAAYDLSAVELIVWEGAAMPRALIERLRQICPRLATNYSMTESTGAITVVAPTDDLDVLSNTVGLPAQGVMVRLVDAAGAAVPRGSPGEVQCRSDNNLLGYWGRPDATRDAYTADGWLRTGDLAIQREDGRYSIVGRLKEMYKSGGYNVYPREVEAVLEAHSAVALAAVVGVPDPVWQEVGVAYVLPKSGVSVAELEAHCRTRLANYKLPKRIVVSEDLPLLPIGKIDKVSLRQRAVAEAADADASRSRIA